MSTHILLARARKARTSPETARRSPISRNGRHPLLEVGGRDLR